MGWLKGTKLTMAIEKVLARMEGWKGSLLNPAGKEILIKAIIQAIPSYIMSIVKLPKTFSDKLIAAVMEIGWSNYGQKNRVHWKRREILCSPKSIGGLGFKDFDLMNSALLTKQAWRIIQYTNSYWANTFKRHLFPFHRFLES